MTNKPRDWTRIYYLEKRMAQLERYLPYLERFAASDISAVPMRSFEETQPSDVAALNDLGLQQTAEAIASGVRDYD